MKSIFFYLFSFFTSWSGFAQDNIYSFYFSKPQPANTNEITFFDKDVIGTYVKKDDPIVDIVIDSNQIEFRYITKMLLTTKEIKNNSQYYFKNNLLHGIDSSKGLEYYIENDTVYFGVYQKELLLEINENNKVKKIENQYILSEKKSDAVWEVKVLYVKGSDLFLRSIDISEEEEKVKQHLPVCQTKRLGGEKIYVNSPSKEQFTKFIEAKGFYDILYYTKK